jgi:phage recombination protein Bet
MSNTQTVVVKLEDKPMEFVPYGAQDKIKLSVAIIKNLICVKTKSGQTCTDNDAIKFMMMCSARRLNPFESDAFLIGYDGKDGPTFSLITAHQAFLKRAELNAEYDGMKSGIIVEQDGEVKDLEGDFYLEGQKPIGGWATVYFKNRKQPMHKRIRLKRFQKSWGIWQDDPAGMICKCAEADALRSSFPTMLGGLYLREEVAAPLPVVSAPIFTPAVPNSNETASLMGGAYNPAQAAMAEPVSHPAPHDTASEPEAKGYNVLKAVKGLIKAAKLDEEQIVASLIEIGSVEPGTKLADVPEDTLQMLHDQFDDIAERIKGEEAGAQ